MIWVAIEDADTHEVSEFAKTDEGYVPYIMSEYRAAQHCAERFVLHDMEDDVHVVFKGVIYEGGFGYNLWVASKYIKL